MPDLELRTVPGTVELRAGKGLGVLTGYAAVFNSRSQNLGGFVEQVDPAAFNKTLGDKAPVIARFNHEDNFPLGTTAAGTLRLFVDKHTGLRYEVDLPDTTAGRDVKELATRGDLHQSSFAFRTVRDKWENGPEGLTLRTLLEVQLIDVAPVMNPAYTDTSVGMRSLAGHLGRRPEEVEAAAAEGRLAAFLAGARPTQREASTKLAEYRRRLELGLF